jgi:urease accessory protein UreE
MFCNRILGTTHHGTYKKVVDVPLLREELAARSIRCIARDGVEVEIEVDEELQEGDIVAETEQNVYAIKIYVPKKRQEVEPPRMNKSYL